MSLPYLGSKRKIASSIYSVIKARHPMSDTVVDLFCGGGAMSEYFASRGWKVISNDKNKYIAALLNRVYSGELKERDIKKYISRQEFTKIMSNPDDFEDWYVGFVVAVWSFGSAGTGYLYSDSAARHKLAMHNLIVDGNPRLALSLGTAPKSAIDMICRQPNRHIRRRAAKAALQQLPKSANRLERIEHLERIERIDKIPARDIHVTSKDYSKVDIPRGAIVYCDPPYEGTAEYTVGSFDSGKFWEWARKTGETNPIYISEYTAPSDFMAVYAVDVRSTLGNNSKTATEKLFTYSPVS